MIERKGVRPAPGYDLLETRHLYAGKVVSVSVRRLILPQGNEVQHEVLTLPSAVAVVPLLAGPSGLEVVLIEQFRSSVEGYIHEIPAGILEQGEDPAACAARELEEETGYRSARVTPLVTLLPIPGTSRHEMHYFLAEDLTPGPQRLESGECLTVRRWPLQDVLRSIAGEGPLEIIDAKTHIGLLHAAFLRGLAAPRGG